MTILARGVKTNTPPTNPLRELELVVAGQVTLVNGFVEETIGAGLGTVFTLVQRITVAGTPTSYTATYDNNLGVLAIAGVGAVDNSTVQYLVFRLFR